MSSEELANVLKQMIVDDLGDKVRILIDRGSKELEDRKNMSDNARDTQFQGFAKCVVEEILAEMKYSVGRTSQDIEKGLEDIIARRAYDFAVHVADNVTRLNRDEVSFYYGENDAVHGIPDMTELPKE